MFHRHPPLIVHLLEHLLPQKCYIRSTAAIAIINRQGKEVEGWFAAEHAYTCCHQGYGRNGAMTLARYAELRDKTKQSIGYAVSAFRIKQVITERSTVVDLFSVRAARDIASLDESDWAWFGTLCIEREWGEKQRQAAIKAVKEIDIPTELQDWLDPQNYKREAALDAANSDAPAIAITNELIPTRPFFFAT